MDGGELLWRRRSKNSERGERHWNFSDVLRKENVLSAPQLRSGRDSCPIERFCPYLGAVIPAHPCHFFCQLRLCVQHPTFIGCRLCSLSSFPSHPSCILSFLQLSFKIQDQLSLGGQFYFCHVKLLALVLSLNHYVLETGLDTQICPVHNSQLVASSLFFYLEAPKARLASVRRLALTLASFRASLTHFSAIKTSWIACT